MILSDTLI